MLTACNCNIDGAESQDCNNVGKCSCKSNVIGQKCEKCKNEYYGFPHCTGKKILMPNC